MYDPVNGIFASLDPFYGVYYMSSSLNKYSYVNNNPIILTDFSGFFTLMELLIAVVIIIIVIAILSSCISSFIKSAPIYSVKATIYIEGPQICMGTPAQCQSNANLLLTCACIVEINPANNRARMSSAFSKLRYSEMNNNDPILQDGIENITYSKACWEICMIQEFDPLYNAHGNPASWGAKFPNRRSIVFTDPLYDIYKWDAKNNKALDINPDWENVYNRYVED